MGLFFANTAACECNILYPVQCHPLPPARCCWTFWHNSLHSQLIPHSNQWRKKLCLLKLHLAMRSHGNRRHCVVGHRLLIQHFACMRHSLWSWRRSSRVIHESNINFFYPKRLQGMALGVNGGFGNLGVSVSQLIAPIVMSTAYGKSLIVASGISGWPANAGFFWFPICGFSF